MKSKTITINHDLAMALLDMLGVASILPFMAVLSSPEIIETNMIYNEMFEISMNFGVENAQHFIFVLGVLLFILLVLLFLSRLLHFMCK